MISRDDNTIVSLDVGDKNIGIARAYVGSLFPQPCAVVAHDDRVIASLVELIENEHAIAVVAGLPRNLSGEDTQQTQSVRDFVDNLKKHLDIPIYFQDEAGTSHQAEQELANSSTKRKGPSASKDALAAVYILEDFIKEGQHLGLFD